MQNYPLFDADNHYFEPRNVFLDYIDPGDRDLALRPVRDEDGIERLYAGDAVHTSRIPLEWRAFDEAPVPGTLQENMRRVAADDGRHVAGPGGVNFHQMEPMRDEFVSRPARLSLLDAQGLAGAVLFPTLGVAFERGIQDDARLTYANIRAFNRWLKEEWGYARDERLITVPLLSLVDLERGVQEVDRILDDGARAVHLRTGPQGRRSPGDPYFDPVWARMNEAGTVLVLHSCRTDYEERISPWWEDSEPLHARSAFKHLQSFSDRPVMDTIGALILHNMFGRFPNIRLAVIEHGSAWVGYFLRALNHAAAFSVGDEWLGGRLEQRPRDIFRQHVWVAPYPEEDAKALVNILGADHVLFGSDYPHAEGMTEPADFVKKLEGLPEHDVAQIMGGNIRDLLKIA